MMCDSGSFKVEIIYNRNGTHSHFCIDSHAYPVSCRMSPRLSSPK